MTTVAYGSPITPVLSKYEPRPVTRMIEEEKTIPFLRRLVDMLQENQTVISFFPGSIKKGQIVLGKIVVHDRLKVESDVLPRYFNHSSFASLRRQLNYFSFTRLGKGRQRGATYCNDNVIEMNDILRLKRRSSEGSSSSTMAAAAAIATPSPECNSSSNFKRGRSVSLSSFSSDGETLLPYHRRPLKKSRHDDRGVVIVSPRTSPVHHMRDDYEPQITLDLTVPSNKELGDDEILAGCRALLSFAKGLRMSSSV